MEQEKEGQGQDQQPEKKQVKSYQIHVCMWEVTKDEGDEAGHTADYDMIHEEEPAGYREEFKDYAEAKQVFEVLTGIKID